jgi:hypothetical protein
MTEIAIAYRIGGAASVAESIPAQAFHLIAPVTLFYPISAHCTLYRMFVDPMEGEFVHFIVSRWFCVGYDLPWLEGSAQHSNDVFIADDDATEGTCRSRCASGTLFPVHPPDEARHAAAMLTGGEDNGQILIVA